MWTLYDYEDSANGYKVRLALHQLAIPYRLVPVDIMRGESRTPAFLEKNPNGRIPVLELEGGAHLAESNAILWYVARGSRLVPASELAFARVLSWLFFEQYSHEPYLATARFILRHLPSDHPRRSELPMRLEQARAALAILERTLARAPFLLDEGYSIADIALYAYTHRAHEATLDLGAYPAICAWIERIEAQPGWVPMLRAAPGS